MSNVRDLFSGTTSGLGFSLRREEATSEYFVIDGDTRKITPPSDFKNFGVESDEDTKRVWFECPQFVGDDIDLATLNLRVNYKNANGELDSYIVEDVEAEDGIIHFSWLLSRKVTKYKGTIQFIVCAIKTNSKGDIVNEWNTTLCTGDVLEGLEVEAPADIEPASDLVDQLINIVNANMGKVEEATAEGLSEVAEAKTKAVEDVETAKTEAVGVVEKSGGTLFANAVKKSVSGEVIRVDDVSPIEHTVKVKISGENIEPSSVKVTRCGKNLFPNIVTDQTFANGSTIKINADGSINVNKVENDTISIYRDVYFPRGVYAISDGHNSSVDVYVQAFEVATRNESVNKTVEWEGGTTRVYLYSSSSVSGNVIVKPQIEKGDTATDFEPYKGETYTPNADGTVDIPSVSPTMTLLTDTEGVTIDVEYNQDTNAALDNVNKDVAELDRVTSEIANDIEENKAEAVETFSNVLKGSASGSTISLDDVSPVAHKVKGKVSGVDSPESVNVTSCGVNLFDVYSANCTSSNGTCTVEPIENGSIKTTIKVKGSPQYGTASIQMPINSAGTLYLKVKARCSNSELTKPELHIRLRNAESGSNVTKKIYTEITTDWTELIYVIDVTSSDLEKYDEIMLLIYVKNNSAAMENLGEYVELQSIMLSAVDEPYKPYNGESYTPNEDGAVEINSISPIMNIFTDTPNAVLDVEYQKDINTAIQKLTDTIAQLQAKLSE
jgi:hypothetical protein